MNAIYIAAGDLPTPRGWSAPFTIADAWRAAIVLWWFYGMDTGTVVALTCGQVHWSATCPDRSERQPDNPHGWIAWRRAKTRRAFVRPMPVEVADHIKRVGGDTRPAAARVVQLGTCRPCAMFADIVAAAGVALKSDPWTGERLPWTIKDLRKTCATEHEAHCPGAGSAILGHSNGLTGKHYANASPRAWQSLTTIVAPSMFRTHTK